MNESVSAAPILPPSAVTGPSGLLLVDKPSGMTSHDVVDRARRLLDTRRVGHTGTLDPAATGLLVLCVGRAARLQSFLTSADKTYEGTLRLGVETDTYDRDGTPVGTPYEGPWPAREIVAGFMTRFVGEFQQSPPPFSAKKVAGKKFYELARRGEAVPDMPKTVRVSRFDLLGMEEETGAFAVACSSGTYVRSLVHEIGRSLGCGAHLTSLRRTTVGVFQLETAATLPQLEEMSPEERTSPPSWIPLAAIPLPFPVISLLPGEAAKIRRGQGVPVRPGTDAAGSNWVRLVSGGELLGVGQLEPLGRGALALARPRIVL